MLLQKKGQDVKEMQVVEAGFVGNINKINMKKLILLFLFIPLVNSCSKESFDENDENEIILLKSARNETKYSDGSISSVVTSYYYENSYLKSSKYEVSSATSNPLKFSDVKSISFYLI